MDRLQTGRRPMRITRERVRLVGAIAAAVMAGIYVLIGLGVLHVGTSTASGTEDPNFMFGFGMGAGAAFALGALLLVLTDWRPLWLLGFVFQVLVYATYVSVSSQREPPFEVWGITLRIVQVPLMLSLAYLSWSQPEPGPALRPLIRTHA
jgi:hypothetical protein